MALTTNIRGFNYFLLIFPDFSDSLVQQLFVFPHVGLFFEWCFSFYLSGVDLIDDRFAHLW